MVKSIKSGKPQVDAGEFYYKVIIQNCKPFFDNLSYFLFEFGALGIEEKEDRAEAYFPNILSYDYIKSEIGKIVNHLKNDAGLTHPVPISIQKIIRENWQQNWMKHFKPIEINDRLIVAPSWEIVPAKPGQLKIIIDPQQAFGTGGHATTYLMLQALLKYQNNGMGVLDIGTGSGILAITAEKLNANAVFAFDNDPVAVMTAAANAALNRAGSRIKFFAGELSALKQHRIHFDLILANITNNVLKTLVPQVSFFAKPSSIFVLSGILIDEKKHFDRFLRENDCHIIEHIEREEWLCLVCRKNK